MKWIRKMIYLRDVPVCGEWTVTVVGRFFPATAGVWPKCEDKCIRYVWKKEVLHVKHCWTWVLITCAYEFYVGTGADQSVEDYLLKRKLCGVPIRSSFGKKVYINTHKAKGDGGKNVLLERENNCLHGEAHCFTYHVMCQYMKMMLSLGNTCLFFRSKVDIK